MAVSFRFDRVKYRYQTRQPDDDTTFALNEVTVELPAEKLTALIGPSGCGKTTLLNLAGLLLGLDPPSFSGTIQYVTASTERNLSSLRPREQEMLRRVEFGYVLQDCYLLPNFSAVQNIALPLALQGWDRERRHARVEDLLKATGDKALLDIREHRDTEMSLGQMQRIAGLRAIVHDPRVVFADEPTSNLDPANTDRIMRLLLRWQRGLLHPESDRTSPRTLILVCHDLETALRVADHIVALNGSHTVAAEFDRERWPEFAERINTLLGTRTPTNFGERWEP